MSSCFGVLMLWVFLWLGAVPASAQIVLNEILADPAQDWDGNGSLSSRDDEWVEIFNSGTTSVDLSRYRIASADTVWRYEFSGTLEPGEVAVVYGSDSYAWEQASGNPAYGLRLANAGGEVTLWLLEGGGMTLADCYTYADHEADDDRSSGRYPDGTGSWLLFDALNPYSGSQEPQGSECAPSPGTGVLCATPVEETSWGKVKILWSGAQARSRR